MQNFITLRQFLNLPPLSPQICDSAGGRGGPRLFLLIGIIIFLLLRSPCKILEPYGDLADDGRRRRRRRREREIMPSLMATLLRWRTHSARTNFHSRRWRSSLTICACLTVRSSPHQREQKFSGAHVCRVTFKHLPNPPEVISRTL